jgi:hypothetical protein
MGRLMQTIAEKARAIVAELRDTVFPWHPRAYSWRQHDSWTIYDGRVPNKALGDGHTEIEAWAAAANSMPPNGLLKGARDEA